MPVSEVRLQPKPAEEGEGWNYVFPGMSVYDKDLPRMPGFEDDADLPPPGSKAKGG